MMLLKHHNKPSVSFFPLRRTLTDMISLMPREQPDCQVQAWQQLHSGRSIQCLCGVYSVVMAYSAFFKTLTSSLQHGVYSSETQYGNRMEI